ncbi:MAG TPA: undecaprenyl-diphosphate phosphatase, partial [Candidatus Paceibacterota bacterium]
MGYLTAIILGVIEGATEFIPVSSSGHLIIVRQLLGENDPLGLSFDAVLQLSATLAIVVYFWRDILNLFLTFFNIISGKNLEKKSRTLLYAIILGTIPAVIFGLLLESRMETVFRNTYLVGITLVL